MKKITMTLTALAFLCIPPLIEAHTRFTTLHVNGQSQGDGICIRQDQNPDTTTNFVPSITGAEMACGVDGEIAVPNTCSVNAGDQIALEHRMWPDGSQPGAIDVSHKGNTAIYMKQITSQRDQGMGGGWFKIYWDGYDAGTGEWGTDHMNSNNGLVTTSIPADLAAGDYLIRSEVLALQEVGDPQFYVGCAQVRLSGSGSVTPSNSATIPGYVDMTTPAMTVNIYESLSLQEYGPIAYTADGSGGNTSNKAMSNSGLASSVLPSMTSAPSDTAVSHLSRRTTTLITKSVHSKETAKSSPFSKSDLGTTASSSMRNNDENNNEDDCKSSGDRHESNTMNPTFDWRVWSKWNNAELRAGRGRQS